MKKVFLLAILATVSIVTFTSCGKSKPKVDYECSGYFSSDDWKITLDKKDSVMFYDVEKNISLRKDFPSSTDSTKFKISFLTKEDFPKLPPGDELRLMLYRSLLSSKSGCKNEGTFKPYEINISFLEDDSIGRAMLIKIDFFASNAYGTPGELHGYFKYDPKTYKLIYESVSE
jgi:hypothetical protein